MKTTDPQNEVFPIVNEKDKVIGKITRKKAHQNHNIIHRAVHVLIFDNKGRLLIQKRSLTKDTAPGSWCASSSGHVGYHEDYLLGAIRETKEELGIIVRPAELELLGKILVVAPWEKEMTQVYKVILSKKVSISPNPEEITKIRFVDLKTLHIMLEQELWAPSDTQVLNRFVLNLNNLGTDRRYSR